MHRNGRSRRPHRALNPSARTASSAPRCACHGPLVGRRPVEVGFVASVNRPGGNITGVSLFTSLLVAKRLELLRELVPAATIIAFLVNPDNSNARPDTAVMQAAAARLGQKLIVLSARTEQ